MLGLGTFGKRMPCYCWCMGEHRILCFFHATKILKEGRQNEKSDSSSFAELGSLVTLVKMND
jgi:hypothetical protein